MSTDRPPGYDPQHPYSSLVRASDRAKVLDDLVSEIWQTALALPLVPVGDRTSAEEPPPTGTRTAVVHLGGAWNGSVALTASVSLANQCASHMFDKPLGGLAQGEVQDSWGELGNMIAGNLKALVLGPTTISLPTVVEGATYAFRVPGATVLNETTYACLGQRLRVTVLRGDAPRRNDVARTSP